MSDLDKRVTDACHRIEELYYETGGKCYVSFSGGKDSTAMLLRMLEEGMPVDIILFCDTGLEFEGMYHHIEKLEKYLIEVQDELFGPAASDYKRAAELEDERLITEDRLMQLYEEEEELQKE